MKSTFSETVRSGTLYFQMAMCTDGLVTSLEVRWWKHLIREYHTDLTELYNADEAQLTLVEDVDVRWSGNDLLIDPANGFTGLVSVVVTASDSLESATQSFSLSIANQVPTVSAIDDLAVSPIASGATVTVNANDLDGDSLSYSAVARQLDLGQQAAYDLDQQYGFTAAHTEAFNYRGQNEKYFFGTNRQWFYILPQGEVFRFGGSLAASTSVGQVGESYHADLSSLLNVDEPTQVDPGATLTWDSNELTIEHAGGFEGTFDVVVTVSDGAHHSEVQFSYTVADRAPEIDLISDQTIVSGDDSVTINVNASDADGESVTLAAQAFQFDEIAGRAFAINDAHNFHASPSDGYNYRGLNERYFHGNGNQWHYILPSGEVYRWGGSIPASLQIESLDSSYHADLNKLFNAADPQETAVNVSLAWNGSDLTVTPDPSVVGDFSVEVTATSGSKTTSQRFIVSVESSNEFQMLDDILAGSLFAAETDTEVPDTQSRASDSILAVALKQFLAE